MSKQPGDFILSAEGRELLDAAVVHALALFSRKLRATAQRSKKVTIQPPSETTPEVKVDTEMKAVRQRSSKRPIKESLANVEEPDESASDSFNKQADDGDVYMSRKKRRRKRTVFSSDWVQ